ncbi:hypothetical protein EV196_10975 [Mariniflexile fucanivorans]|uniref:Uncharacterized protein n=1 Tax=Mariniflexile fucanivorans TaxID=264023 RepID=A0A4R1RC89_9FLAO|nr:hypothetical protein EV196_10975 [Mariniflexile fucanivorans]
MSAYIGLESFKENNMKLNNTHNLAKIIIILNTNSYNFINFHQSYKGFYGSYFKVIQFKVKAYIFNF